MRCAGFGHHVFLSPCGHLRTSYCFGPWLTPAVACGLTPSPKRRAYGFAVYLTIMFGAASVIRTQTGVVIDVWQPHAALLYTPIGMVLVGCLAGILPAFKAYSTDVATNLVPTT